MKDLSEEDRAIYEWQLDVPGFGEAGQLALQLQGAEPNTEVKAEGSEEQAQTETTEEPPAK